MKIKNIFLIVLLLTSINVEAGPIDDINDPRLPGKIQQYRMLISENLNLAEKASSNRDSKNYLKYTCKVRKYSDEYIELLSFIHNSGIKIQELDKEKEVIIKKNKEIDDALFKKTNNPSINFAELCRQNDWY
jgi:hypothetical protein